MEYTVDRIPGQLRIDPEAGGQERQKKREKQTPRPGKDSVSISDEARNRSIAERETEEES